MFDIWNIWTTWNLKQNIWRKSGFKLKQKFKSWARICGCHVVTCGLVTHSVSILQIQSAIKHIFLFLCIIYNYSFTMAHSGTNGEKPNLLLSHFQWWYGLNWTFYVQNYVKQMEARSSHCHKQFRTTNWTVDLSCILTVPLEYSIQIYVTWPI